VEGRLDKRVEQQKEEEQRRGALLSVVLRRALSAEVGLTNLCCETVGN
jgi:hypothetical protein